MNENILAESEIRPSETFARLLRFVSICSTLVGGNVISPNYRPNWVTGIVVTSIIGYFIFTGITIAEIFEENPTYMLEAFCMLGSVLQGIAKLYYGIKKTKILVDIISQLENLYTTFETVGPDYCNALTRNCRRSRNIIIMFACLYIICASGVMATPFIVMITGKRTMMMHFMIPGLDIETIFGYFATMGAHSVCMFAASFGLFSGDLVIVISITHLFLFTDLWTLKIKDLNTCIYAERDSKQRKLLLYDLIEWHITFDEFSKTCNTTFYEVVAVQITTSGISILCSLYIFICGDWPGVYSYMLFPFASLYAYCMLGTQIDICNERFCNEIFNIDFYMLPATEQKLISVILMKAQTPATIKIGGVMPLTVQTALQITKTIYSIFMMMVQFLVE